MNVCCFLVVEKWTPIVLILDHILQVPHSLISERLPIGPVSKFRISAFFWCIFSFDCGIIEINKDVTGLGIFFTQGGGQKVGIHKMLVNTDTSPCNAMEWRIGLSHRQEQRKCETAGLVPRLKQLAAAAVCRQALFISSTGCPALPFPRAWWPKKKWCKRWVWYIKWLWLLKLTYFGFHSDRNFLKF